MLIILVDPFLECGFTQASVWLPKQPDKPVVVRSIKHLFLDTLLPWPQYNIYFVHEFFCYVVENDAFVPRTIDTSVRFHAVAISCRRVRSCQVILFGKLEVLETFACQGPYG